MIKTLFTKHTFNKTMGTCFLQGNHHIIASNYKGSKGGGGVKSDHHLGLAEAEVSHGRKDQV